MIYAVLAGYMTGFFPDWNTASAHVNGYPNAHHKKFEYARSEDAFAFLTGAPWYGDEPPSIVIHPEGWLALVDLGGDVASQVEAARPQPGTAPPDTVAVCINGVTVKREIDANLVLELDRLHLLPEGN